MEAISLQLTCANDSDIAALPSDMDMDANEASKAILVDARLVLVNLGGVEEIHLAGYVSPTKIRMTSPVIAYDPVRLLVRTQNSLYSVRSPLKEGDMDNFMVNALIRIILGHGNSPIDTPHNVH